MKSFDIVSALKNNSEYIESFLSDILSCEAIGDGDLADAMRYAVLGGGKRIRAFLVMETGRIFGATPEMCVPFAAGIEMIHAYSLVHDDLPAMDNDDMRRGKPSCHKAFGEATALLAGDALLSLAFEVTAGNKNADPRSAALTAAEYGRLSGVLGMAGGQEIDLGGNAGSYDELCRMYNLKTGALICASLFAGYFAASPVPDQKIIEKLKTYGLMLGLAFQIQDDVLDVCGDEAVIGKPVGSDSKNDKHTSLAYMSVDEAIHEYEVLTDKAIDAISDIPGSESLTALALHLCKRNN
ncbi:MAG: polyprenyl synthetase family protein [Ruminococcaceae bacterium]|nr:polyprenyl synthetase family protein [Oscillospiraceae bacterium]